MAEPTRDGAQRRRPPNPFGDFAPSLNFYPSTSHRKVVHRITRSLESSCGMVLVTGEIGIGKTSVGLYVREEFADRFAFVLLGNPFLSPAERVEAVLEQLDAPPEVPRTMDGLEAWASEMFRAGRPPVLIVDECHLLQREGFTQLQVLSNLREGGSPLVQMLLVGQVEIAERLREPGMEAFNQRIGVRCEVEPMNLHDTRRYVEFKLEKAGHPSPEVFEPRAVERIWRISGGLPRLINHACSYALDQVTFCGLTRVTPRIVDDVVRDSMYRDLYAVRTKGGAPPWARVAVGAGLVALGALVVVGSGRVFGWWGGGAAPEAAPRAAATPGTREPASAEELAQPGQPRTGQRAAGSGAGAATPAAPQPQEASAQETGAALAREAHSAPERIFEAAGGAADVAAANAFEEEVPPVARAEAGGEDAGVDENLAASERFRVNEAFADDPEPAPGGDDVVDRAAMPGLDPPYAGSPVQGSRDGAPVADGALDESAPPDAESLKAGGGRVREGAGHPVVGAVSINAVAWSEDDGARIAVLDGRVLREGGSLPSGIVLVRIGKKDLLLEYRGALYRLVWNAQSDETE